MKRKGTGKATEEKSCLPQTFVFCRGGAGFSNIMTGVFVLVLAFATLGLTLDPAPLVAKRKKPPTSKTVVGQVLDPSGNGIAGAAVEMKDLATGRTLAIYAGPQGHFQFTDLKLTESYQFQAHYKGQKSQVREVSSWDTRMNLVLNLQIPAPKD